MAKKKDSKRSDLDALELKGPVHRVKQLNYKTSRVKGEITKGEIEWENYEFMNHIITFDEKGFKIEKLDYMPGGSFHTITFKNGLDIVTTGYLTDGTVQYHSLKEYDEKGRAISIDTDFCNQPEHCSKMTYTYDDNDKPIELHQYGPTGVLASKHLMYYDKRGFNIEMKATNGDGSLLAWHTYKHDDHGQQIEDNTLNAEGEIVGTVTHTIKYNSEGKIILYDGRDWTSFFETETNITYDNKYEYDAHGNWIKKTIFYKDKPINIHLREINYYGEEATITNSIMIDKNDETPIPEPEAEQIVPAIHQEVLSGIDSLDGKQLMWLADGSASDTDFSALRYYVLMNNTYPSVTTHSEDNIEVKSLLEELKNDMEAEVVHASYDTDYGNGIKMESYTVSFPNNEGYLLQVSDINDEDADSYDTPSHIETDDYGRVFTGTVMVLHPSDRSGERDETFEDEIEALVSFCSLETLPEKPMIYMIQMSGPNWYLRHHAVDDSFEIKDLDLNYGTGFTKFNEELMQRFRTETKGLVLFHGEPGTGKTYYIRHLLRSMVANKKIVIYMPPNMVDHMVEPGFMTFISQTVDNYTRQGHFCVLLIEDAEPLLQARQSDTRIQGVTNLLNMTDGLLNDMLKLQIICTFNVNLKKLDKALLRPGRLLARKEFKALPELEANILASRLGVKHTFTAPATIAEIYALTKNKNTLIHGVE